MKFSDFPEICGGVELIIRLSRLYGKITFLVEMGSMNYDNIAVEQHGDKKTYS